jgi:hypothetical protein
MHSLNIKVAVSSENSVFICFTKRHHTHKDRTLIRQWVEC